MILFNATILLFALIFFLVFIFLLKIEKYAAAFILFIMKLFKLFREVKVPKN